ncbi:MAG: uroporphyrinogen decarboxylase family protein [Clostridia bacterium]|nr:uroporphyrinogen decarboxylase family protein [Clostridia bacterium]
MKKDMKEWLSELNSAKKKKALPILSFPSVSLLGCSVRDLIADSELQAEGMRLIAQKTNAYASVSFMDLSVEAECFGAKVHFSDDEVPTVVGRLLVEPEDAKNLKVPKVGSARSGIYVEAIKKAVERIHDRPVLAGMIGPFSLVARLIDVSEAMIYCYDEPEMIETVLNKVTEFLIEYAKAYKAVGAHGVVIAEPVAGMLSPSLEEEFSSPYVKKIVDAVQDDSFIVVYHNCGNNVLKMTESILSTGAAAYHYGNAIDMGEMMEKMPSNVLVMGNLDPAATLKDGTVEKVKEQTVELLNKCSKYPNFIPSSGCDIPPLTPWKNIEAFFETVDGFKAK